MEYKEFRKWCNDRAFDGCWSMENARRCITIIETFKHIPFWKREKVWKKYKNFILNNIVIPTNNIIANLKESDK